MKGKRISFTLLLIIVLLSSVACKKEENGRNYPEKVSVSELSQNTSVNGLSFEKIDISNATIIIPEFQGDTIKVPRFPIMERDFDVLEEKLIETVKDFFGLEEVIRDDFVYDFVRSVTEEASDVNWEIVYTPMDSATLEEKKISRYLLYNDKAGNSAVLYLSTYMVELSRGGVIKEIIPDIAYGGAENWVYGVRPMDEGTLIKTYQLPSDDITGVSYELYDGELALSDAIDLAETGIKKNYSFVGSPHLDYQVYEAQVRKLEHCYYYAFKIKAVYENVAFGNESGLFVEGEETTKQGSCLYTQHIVSIFRKEAVDFIWSSCHSYETVEVLEEITEIISLGKACEYLDKFISDDVFFEINEVEFLYEPRLVGDFQTAIYDELVCYPVYQFICNDPKISGYKIIYFVVDAVEGTIRITAE